ncbi:MAG: hypothetical protein HOV81_34670 [Kofleriaceae bacterium]|nr:hypothetical protein [Kofleriaceae bacterium]
MKAASIVIAAALAVVASAGRAYAYPQFELAKDQSCSGCHLSPTGGGPLSENGMVTAEAISKFGMNPEFMYGAVKTPDWLVVGGDLRGAYGYLQAPQRYIVGFPMQADFYGVVTQKNFSLHVTAGFRPEEDGNEAATHFWSREHYAMWQSQPGSPEGLFVRAGRFMPVFGLRLAEHNVYTRRYGGTPLYADTYGIGASYISSKIDAHITGFVKDPLIDPVNLYSGAAIYSELSINPLLKIGAGGMVQVSDFDHKFRGTLTAKHYIPSADLLIQAEVQIVNPHVSDFGYMQTVGYLMATKFLPAGLMLDIGLGHFDSNIRIKGLDRDCVDANLHWFATSHIELMLTNRLELMDFGNGGPTGAYSLLMAHYRL